MEMFYRNWRWLVLSFGGWTLFGVFFALQNYVNAVYFGQDISFWTTLAVWLICGYAWGNKGSGVGLEVSAGSNTIFRDIFLPFRATRFS